MRSELSQRKIRAVHATTPDADSENVIVLAPFFRLSSFNWSEVRRSVLMWCRSGDEGRELPDKTGEVGTDEAFTGSVANACVITTSYRHNQPVNEIIRFLIKNNQE